MNAEEYVKAYNRISDLKEFEDERFLYLFITQVVASMFLLSSEPEALMNEFWEAVNRKEKTVTKAVQDKINEAVLTKKNWIKKHRFQAMLFPSLYFLDDSSAVLMPDWWYEKTVELFPTLDTIFSGKSGK